MKFYLKAGTVYNVHSPFVFQFTNSVLDTDKEYYIFKKLEKYRSDLLKSEQVVSDIDYGAGTSIKKDQINRKVKQVAKTSLSNRRTSKILFNLINYFQPDTVLEIGTSLGLSSAYLAAAKHNCKIITLEGNPELADIAGNLHKDIGLENIQIIKGNFDVVLDKVLGEVKRIDVVFMDGNHRFEPTIRYFNQLLPYCHENTVIIIDDIYWSNEMSQAWEDIRKSEKVSLTIDVFDLGFVFMNKSLSKENLKIVPYWYKPWRIGLFGN
ncbi:MAG: class I SAM-dependent methyltransferase [Saprospiraceae bacterium]|nr:class I SAM-dependent methyltransferase [Saprospiraceae bacterium]